MNLNFEKSSLIQAVVIMASRLRRNHFNFISLLSNSFN